MTLARLWAPHAQQVELLVGETRAPMCREPTGWWSIRAAELVPGADYGFAIDGGEVLPDPRSAWQPRGVHARSRLLDHGAYRWGDDGWQPPPLASAVIYELHVGTFTREGSFESAIERLDYLRQLGVTHVELMPVNEFAGSRGWGYDGVDLFAPHHAYGGPEGLKRLVDACHAHGLAVLLDVVYNHLGPDGNYLQRFGPYFTDAHVTPWGPAINLDGRGSDEVRRFLCDNACMWLRDYHADGLRIDAIHSMLDRSATPFLEQLAGEVAALETQLGRSLVLIAESDLNDPRILRPSSLGGYGLAAQWSDDFHHAVHALLTGERDGYYADFGSLSDVIHALQHTFVYDGRYSHYRGRRHGRSAAGLSGHRFVAFIQNHDQVGNRARGERLSQILVPERLKLAAGLLLCGPFVPLLFQGEEWGASTPFLYFTDHRGEIGDSVRDGRKREFAAFGWDPDQIPDPQAFSSFYRSKLDWAELEEPPHSELLQWYRTLIALRARRAELRDGSLERVQVASDGASRWLQIRRGSTLIALNLAPAAAHVPLHAPPDELLARSTPEVRFEEGGLVLPPSSVAIAAVHAAAGSGHPAAAR